MCESKVLLNGKVVMEDVVRIVVKDDKVKVYDILGSSKELKAKVVEVDLLGHKVLLEGLDG
ncbi:MAG: CooT family nickel-binding protein [Archaeoglobaceae archaeon]|nr:CooT family nickel-binding protein [Archaeoglobaceae archaeon]MCX8151702.1 CooT family nickel-binding protein [Archaeoglobaceae archaeon]MDW8013020.1 CooT family nickel-binding protein [Archaeoglobaceae archaeon]